MCNSVRQKLGHTNAHVCHSPSKRAIHKSTSGHFPKFMTPLPPLVGSGYYIGLCSKSALRGDPLPPPLRRRRIWMAPNHIVTFNLHDNFSTVSLLQQFLEMNCPEGPWPTIFQRNSFYGTEVFNDTNAIHMYLTNYSLCIHNAYKMYFVFYIP